MNFKNVSARFLSAHMTLLHVVVGPLTLTEITGLVSNQLNLPP